MEYLSKVIKCGIIVMKLGDAMIKKLYFKNFYSFKTEQFIEFNSESNVYVIYGKNAAGKTNLLGIINYIKSSIVDPIDFEALKRAKNAFSNDNPVVEAAFIVSIDEKQYYYGINVNTENKCIETQELFELDTNENKIEEIFSFNNEQVSSTLLNTEQLSILNNYNIMKHGVFKYIEELKESTGVKAIKGFQEYFNHHLSMEDALEELNNNKDFRNEVIEEIKKIDIGINDIKIEDISDKIVKLQDQIKDDEEFNKDTKNKILEKLDNISKYKLTSIHDNNIELDFSLESLGTHKYFNKLMEYLLFTKIDNKIIIEDELESSFHEDVFKQFIKFYQANFKSQLIFTTHSQLILEEKLLPKESIIIIDRKENDSVVYKLSDFKDIRSDNRHNWKKIYNNYRIGGKPNVK